MNKKLIYYLMGAALIFFLCALIIFFNSKNGSKKNDTGLLIENNSQQDLKAPEIQQIKIFFLTEDPSYMKPVTYEIQRPPIYQDIYRQVLELMLKGAENCITPVPEEVTVRSVYYLGQKKMLIIDFSEELANRLPSGSTSELEFIYFIVNNICYNFKEIKSVKFLIAGNEYGEITGHIDIGNPFYPDQNYFQNLLE